MKRLMTLFLVAFLAISMMFISVQTAQAHHQRGPCPIDWRYRWVAHHDTQPIRQLIRCATTRWSVPGGAGKALSVAACESGLRPDAYGAGNGGVFQHRLLYWQGRFDSLTSPWWRLQPSIYNGRTNVIVSIRMVHFGGWGPWEQGACA